MSERDESALCAGQQVGGGRFRLERLVGRGGMGAVWLAFDERLREPVALKFIAERISGKPMALDSMRKETSRCHSLSHQNIVRIHDLHETDGEPAFISMEYVVGQNLHELAMAKANNAFALNDVWRWTRQLCSALNYAHSRGVIHRDLKPANLMLDSAGELKLADFGLAAALRDPAHVEEGSISGTPAYMSPQQFAGAPAAVTDDIYALGACVFELLSGTPLFKGPDLRYKIEFEPAPMLSRVLAERGLSADIPEAFTDLIQRCLSKNPSARPQSAESFLNLALSALVSATEPADAVVQPKGKRGMPTKALVLTAVVAVALALILKPRKISYLDLKNAPVRASSFAPPSYPRAAFDGLHCDIDVREEYRWASGTADGDASEWIAVDLGRDMRLASVLIDWELAYAKNFSLRTRTSAEGWADDPAQWTQRAIVNGFAEKTRHAVNAVTNEVDVLFDFARKKVEVARWMSAQQTEIDGRAFAARYVMIHPTARGANNPGVYSIHEIKIAAQPVDK